MEITSYNHHAKAPFCPAVLVLTKSILSSNRAFALIQSRFAWVWQTWDPAISSDLDRGSARGCAVECHARGRAHFSQKREKWGAPGWKRSYTWRDVGHPAGILPAHGETAWSDGRS